ncbi:MAG: hypothetical protein OXG18_04835, partial [Gemmatimonadetes bacterium]|nr:hypothetical protein [Gemmatimonadota bacterium]
PPYDSAPDAPHPPRQVKSLLPEQTTIVEYVEKRAAAIGTAIASARRQIDLLQEYRTRLIADVVTGKLDVREAAGFRWRDHIRGSRGLVI